MPSVSTRIGTASSLAASAVYRCQRQPRSSTATRRPPRLRSTCQSTVSAWEATQPQRVLELAAKRDAVPEFHLQVHGRPGGTTRLAPYLHQQLDQSSRPLAG